MKKEQIWMKMRKWKIRCNYCGDETYENYYYLLLKRVFKPKYYRTCNKCHKTSAYLFMPHIVHDTIDKKEKEMNKQQLWDERM